MIDARDSKYDRQERISWWSQARLRDARVLVVGAGALGNEIVKNLALVGVGHVTVVDFDTVDVSNLARCLLFREADEGRPKAAIAAKAAMAINPDVQVEPIVGDVRTSVGLRGFAAADVVIGGLDSREARLFVNQACWKTGTPWVDGAIEGLRGVARAFVPPDSACYDCTLSERDYELLAFRRSCSLLTREEMDAGRTPTTATTAAVIGGIQVQEAVKLLHGLPVLSGRGFAFNGETHDSYVVEYFPRDHCDSHDGYDLERGIPVSAGITFRQLLERANAAFASDDVFLQLEHDVVTGFRCDWCETASAIRRTLVGTTALDAQCEGCGRERSLDFTHRVSALDPDLLDATPEEVGIPSDDVITAYSTDQRIHYLLTPAARWVPSMGPCDLPPSRLGEIFDHAQTSGCEIGGVLLGVANDDHAVVTHIVPALQAESAQHSVTFTHAAWEEIFAALDAHDDALTIVGWYHSHPGFGIFLSEYDLFIQRNFFQARHQIAVVVDPTDGSFGTFGWVNDELGMLSGHRAAAAGDSEVALAIHADDLDTTSP